ncbi:MAG TPA: histidine triad nucleotide-binding protein [Gemmatimonadaceae bacterium]|nr:histidine triad nucleotide-binding protein [Gemmatimonadaceae bacterium]
MSDGCLFCRIVAREIPATIIAETDDALAFRDINPAAPVHFLVIPRKHVDSLAHATDEAVLGHLMAFAAKVAAQEGIDQSGYRTVINTRRDGGQTVDHLHLHVLGGRRMTWPPG